jgi:DNA-binding winged helix-turn-helix (wHTH) protein
MTGYEFTDICLFDGFRFDRRAGGLFRLDEAGTASPVALGSRALDLLALLLRRNGEPVAKDEIMTVVWSGRAVEEANLNVQISKLRHILDRGRPQGSCIQTITGYGYRFIAAATPVGSSATRQSGLLAEQAGGADAAKPAKPWLPGGRPSLAGEGGRALPAPSRFEGDAYAVLRSIYRDPRQPIALRIAAAKAALPFEREAIDETRRPDDGEPGDITPPAKLPAKLAPRPERRSHDDRPHRLSLAASR